MKVIQLLPVSLLVLCSCHSNTEPAQLALSELVGDTIVIHAGNSVLSAIKTAPVQQSNYAAAFTTPGMVKINPVNYAEIAAPFSGRVTKSYLQLGMKCTPRTPLLEISSPDFSAAQKNYLQEKSQLEQAGKTLKRQQDLFDHAAGTAKDLEEAQTAYNMAKQELNNAAMALKVFKADPSKMAPGQPLVIYSPISGEVLDNKVTVGQYLRDDGSAIATIAALDKIWIAAQVKEKDIAQVHSAESCTVTMPSDSATHLPCRIFHIAPVVDNDTRSLQVILEVDNQRRQLNAGMYVTVRFRQKPAPALVIPTKAVFTGNDESFVFLQTAPGRYIRRRIKIASQDAGQTVVASGLQQNEVLVTEGGLLLQDIR